MDWTAFVLEKVLPFALANWAFIAVALILGLLGEVIRAVVLNGGSYDPLVRGSLRWLYARTFPLHALVLGGLLGCVLGPLAPTFVPSGLVGSVVYFALAGLFSGWLYHAVSEIAPEALEWLRAKLHGKV